jgi:putative transposase
VERLHGERFRTIRQAKDAVLAWLLWHNRQRMHSTLNYLSPVEFEKPLGEHSDVGCRMTIDNQSRRWKCRPTEDDQLDLQALHRVRNRWVARRTAVMNQIRGFLMISLL